MISSAVVNRGNFDLSNLIVKNISRRLCQSTPKFNVGVISKPLNIYPVNSLLNKNIKTSGCLNYNFSTISNNHSHSINSFFLQKKYKSTDNNADELTAPKQSISTEGISETSTPLKKEKKTEKKEKTIKSEKKTKKEKKKRFNSLKGGVFGFLLGFSTVFGIGYYYLIQDYQVSNDSLKKSIEELQTSISKIKRNNRESDELIEELKVLKKSVVTKQEFDEFQNNIKLILDEIKKGQIEESSNLLQMNDKVAKNLQQKNNFCFFLPSKE